jgi:hypothetical protein
VSLRSGTAWLRTAGPFTVGLPRRAWTLAAGTDAALALDDDQVLVGVAAGRGILGPQPDDPGTMTLIAGQASDGATIFPWLTVATWEGDGNTRALRVDGDPPAWGLSFRALCAGDDDALELRPSASAGALLRLRPGLVEVQREDGTGERRQLDGAPRLMRHYHLRQRHPGSAQLVIDGQGRGLDLPFIQPPRHLVLRGGARLEDCRFHTGPPPRPGMGSGPE